MGHPQGIEKVHVSFQMKFYRRTLVPVKSVYDTEKSVSRTEIKVHRRPDPKVRQTGLRKD